MDPSQQQKIRAVNPAQPAKPIAITDLRKQIAEAYAPHAGELLSRKSEVKFLVPGAIPRGNVVLVAGAPGGGKTWFCYELAYAVASGRPWLDQGEPAVQTPVLILNYDQPTDTVANRMRWIGFTKDMPVYVHSLGLSKLWRPGLPEMLKLMKEKSRLTEVIRYIKPGLVLVDAVRQCSDLDENSSKDMAALMSVFKEWIPINDTTSMLIHHTTKAKEGSAAPQARGSGEIIASSDVEIDISESKAVWSKHRTWPIGKTKEVSFSVTDAYSDAEVEGSDEIELVKTVNVRAAGPLPGQPEREAVAKIVEVIVASKNNVVGWKEIQKGCPGMDDTTFKEALRNSRLFGKTKYVRTESGFKGYRLAS